MYFSDIEATDVFSMMMMMMMMKLLFCVYRKSSWQCWVWTLFGRAELVRRETTM